MTSGKYKRTLKPIVCGTQRAYQAHRKRGEDCPICKTAHAAHKKSLYKSRPKHAPTRQDKREFVIKAKFKARECAHCQLKVTQQNWVIFDWDHINPLDKSFQLSNSGNYSIHQITNEIAKCQLLCSNCHRLHTYKEKHYVEWRLKEQKDIHQSLFLWQELVNHDQ